MDSGDSTKFCGGSQGEATCGAEEDVVCDGKYVVIDRGDQQRIILFNSGQTISYGKGPTQQNILLKEALGCSFLSAFKVSPAPAEVIEAFKTSTKTGGDSKKGKQRVPSLFVLERSLEAATKIIGEFYQLPDSISSGVDNRNIVDDNTSQKLKKHDIVSLREQGLPSKEILDTIITSSKSFGQKTEYAQEKYLKKKEKIYGDVLLFRKPSISILSEYYLKRDSIKVLGLRPDTISQILSYANIHANGKYLIFENCCGIIVAAVLFRLGGLGTALHCHIGSNPQRQALVCMNFTDEDLKPMMNLDMLYMIKGCYSTGKSEKDFSEGPEIKKPRLDEDKIISPPVIPEADNNGKEVIGDQSEPDEESEPAFVTSRKLRKTNNKEDNEKSLAYLNQTEFDGLIICGKEHPLTIFQKLLPRLAASTPFVIYCQHPEPLMDCYVWAKEKGVGTNVHLVDNWLRNIQVETERTHPEVNMSSSGGYLLFGIYTGVP